MCVSRLIGGETRVPHVTVAERTSFGANRRWYQASRCRWRQDERTGVGDGIAGPIAGETIGREVTAAEQASLEAEAGGTGASRSAHRSW